MKTRLLSISLSLLALFTLACQPNSASVTGPQREHQLMGTSVSYASPSDPWKERVKTVGEENADLGFPAETVLGIIYRKQEQDGLITISALEQQKNEKGELIELENDKETLNRIANWVVKRDGSIAQQEYIKVLGVNAYHMTFEIGNDSKKQIGEQVHFTKDGKHYSLSILVPAQDYDAEVQHFRNLVSSLAIN